MMRLMKELLATVPHDDFLQNHVQNVDELFSASPGGPDVREDIREAQPYSKDRNSFS